MSEALRVEQAIPSKGQQSSTLFSTASAWKVQRRLGARRRTADARSAYFFSPAGGRFGTSVGSYFAPADTWMRVMRTFVGKNFS